MCGDRTYYLLTQQYLATPAYAKVTESPGLNTKPVISIQTSNAGIYGAQTLYFKTVLQNYPTIQTNVTFRVTVYAFKIGKAIAA